MHLRMYICWNKLIMSLKNKPMQNEPTFCCLSLFFFLHVNFEPKQKIIKIVGPLILSVCVTCVINMWPSEEKRVALIRSGLPGLNQDVCNRCVLRLAGIRNSKEHEKAETVKVKKNVSSFITVPLILRHALFLLFFTGNRVPDLPGRCRAEFQTHPGSSLPGLSWRPAGGDHDGSAAKSNNDINIGFFATHLTFSNFQVCSEIQTCGYDCPHFTIAISLPVSLALREHSINLYLKEKLGEDADFDEDDVVPIKQVRPSIRDANPFQSGTSVIWPPNRSIFTGLEMAVFTADRKVGGEKVRDRGEHGILCRDENRLSRR